MKHLFLILLGLTAPRVAMPAQACIPEQAIHSALIDSMCAAVGVLEDLPDAAISSLQGMQAAFACVKPTNDQPERGNAMFSFRKRKRIDPLDHVLFSWDGAGRDNFTLRDLCSNLWIAGRTGAGKTSSSGKAVMRSIANCPGSGLLVLAATREDLSVVQQCLHEARRENALIEFSATSKHRINFLDYIAKTGGGAREVAKFLEVLTETVRSGNRGGEENAFFKGARGRAIEIASTVLLNAHGEVTVETLAQFFAQVANTPEQVKDQKWQSGFHCQSIHRAIANAKSEVEKHDMLVAVEYFCNELPHLDSKTKSNILIEITGLLHILNTGIVRQCCSGETTFTPDDLFAGAWIVCNFPPNVYGDAGTVISVGLKYLQQRAILARDVKPDDTVAGVFCDEAQQFIFPSYDGHYLATCRSRLGFMIFLTQSVSGLYSAMGVDGEHKTEALLANFTYAILHTCDVVTAEWGQRKIGKSLQTFFGGSMAPHADVYDELFGDSRFSGSFSTHYEDTVQACELTSNLRTGGPANNYLVDGIVIRSGKLFSNGQNWQKVTWRQK